ncbi:hydroxymethylpyrimidine/phosphomethylpyrimidine kinase [Corynebacterium sp. MC-04]|uniref:Hydroxymethylpyrimidine/phosphomethylpyrimidine kinase n=1 Tax=Corynebacterium parakroppenstedtii TaxID=2828363 RepID=A0ABS9HIS4_9CORY|nr:MULTISPECIES: hydroxymethylpyrimidine/phosphomethylpyrimidine kinase [Corynebacterium]MDU3197092.1 hydroxymethylpyrimidine/phosphomethylpyrimidine kinase [Corynebacterium kroppenstedtii]MBY0792421.1 hydroxymethylpyrimidine/phosphomethylpyrimidine kinase [Corynebacterium parakroppenstedtii]MBY0795823.1 hydroxymethylpyrimidine/phosphomethylpyrimidine kinase [Corynebacterium parakroppenstedtii]MCF6769372.1 hydroxymethylpyrimidine/phosphomethylpyrimidine kinase [Corynebacterium parakroppenstedti
MTSSPSSPKYVSAQLSSPIPVVLTIAGSDSSGGAGIQADMKTISALGGFGCVAITAVTAQNTRGVDGAQYMDPEFVAQQIQSVVDDYPIDAIKIGMVGRSSTAETITSTLKSLPFSVPVVWDPVMVASSGSSLVEGNSEVIDGFVELARSVDALTPNGRELVGLCDMVDVPVPDVLRKHLAKLVGEAPGQEKQKSGSVITEPDSNTTEERNSAVDEGSSATHEVGRDETSTAEEKSLTSAIAEAASSLAEALKTVIVVTGGPDNGFGDDGPQVTEVVADHGETVFLSHDRVDTTNTHGTGCTFSSALATYAARRAYEVEKDGLIGFDPTKNFAVDDWRAVVHDAATWTREALAAADTLDLAIGLHRNRDSNGTAEPAHIRGNAPLDHFWKYR